MGRWMDFYLKDDPEMESTRKLYKDRMPSG